MSAGAAAASGALAVLILALVVGAVALPRYRAWLVAAASAAAGALATLLLLRRDAREEAPKTRGEPREEEERVTTYADPSEGLREELREERQRIERWTDEELRDRLRDYDARARGAADERGE